MIFHSAEFLIFFLIVLVLFYMFRKGRIVVLALGNVAFYAASSLGMLAIFVLMTVMTFLIVHRISSSDRRAKMWLTIGIVLNVLNLAFFKYTMFIVGSLDQLFRFTPPLADLVPELVLPIGISFYTFQFISYIVDVYRKELVPTRSFMKFWVYISLFPQLVAGPIIRGSELIPQLDQIREKHVRWGELKFGLYLIIVGLMKKVLLADSLANVVNPLYAPEKVLSGVEAWWATFAFGFQIYFDFSAYSDMAMGLAAMLGIRLVINFNSPYLSSNPSEFWARWHMTLSRWIRDYIYIPLGGNRKKSWRVNLNLFLAMLISGLWHGAMWTFVIWGALHGLLSIVYKWTLWFNRWDGIRRFRKTRIWRIVSVFVFFHIVTWTWVFFRAQSLSQALDMTRAMWTVNWLELWTYGPMIWVVLLYVLHLIEHHMKHHEKLWSDVWHKVPFPLRSVAYTGIVLVILYFLKGETFEFIYFQF